MAKRIICLLLIMLTVIQLSGCSTGKWYEKEYLVVEDYLPSAQNLEISQSERITVTNISGLRRAIVAMIEDYRTDGIIVFDASYDGDADNDMKQICWNVRTQNALCAYCVENISYELSKIVTYSEAVVHITYVEGADVNSVISLSYAVGIEELLRNAMSEASPKLAIYVSYSTYTADRIKSMVQAVYRNYPLICPVEPEVDVYMYSGTGYQRLYDINFDYGLTETELIKRQSLLANIDIKADMEWRRLSDEELCLKSCLYLSDKCTLSDDEYQNTAYDALIMHSANSEGLALAYVELCRQLECSCQIVYGQKNRTNHCWNIVKIDGEYYHVDISACIECGAANGFLLSDINIWGDYRWDTASYPACNGSLAYVSDETQTADESEIQPKPENESENIDNNN